LGVVVALLLFVALVVLCIVALFVFRMVRRDATPVALPAFATWTPAPLVSPTEVPPSAVPTEIVASEAARLEIAPQQGYINTLITVQGQGMWPGESVFVFLRSESEGAERGYAYAAAVADDQGRFRTGLTFPNEMRWIGEAWADVIARGTRSGQEVGTRFTLVAPTPTNTPLPPTPRPTRAPTRTPLPTPTPGPTNTPQPSPTPEVIINDWRGEYFANPTLGGAPSLVRNDVSVDFDWGSGSPGEGLPADGFSVRWTRYQYFSQGNYHFSLTVDDGVRFWIDGRLVVDAWQDSLPTTYEFDRFLSEGEHGLHLEYYEGVGGAIMQLRWVQALPTPPSPQAWRGEYYANPTLQGQPVLLAPTLDVSFNWGVGSPGVNIPADDFSARWTRELEMPAGTYRFSAQADDGVRFWLDGQLVIDAWPADISRTYTAEVQVTAGRHHQQVEYYEATGGAAVYVWMEQVP
jgi:hypothetical protein